MGDLEESIWLMHLKRVTMHHQHRVKCRNCSVQEEWVSISTLLASCYIYFANFPIAGWAKIGIWWHEWYSHGSHFTGAPPRFSGNESGGDPQLRASMEGLDWFCPPYWFGPAQQWSTTTRRWTVSASSQPGMYVCTYVVYLKNQIWRIIVYGHHSHLARAIWRPSLSS